MAVWTKLDNPQNFYIPTPFNCLVKDLGKEKKLEHKIIYDQNQKKWIDSKTLKIPPDDKYAKGTWIAIEDWQKLNQSKIENLQVKTAP